MNPFCNDHKRLLYSFCLKIPIMRNSQLCRQPNSFIAQFYLQILPHYYSGICLSQNYTCNAQFYRKKIFFLPQKQSFKYKRITSPPWPLCRSESQGTHKHFQSRFKFSVVKEPPKTSHGDREKLDHLPAPDRSSPGSYIHLQQHLNFCILKNTHITYGITFFF